MARRSTHVCGRRDRPQTRTRGLGSPLIRRSLPLSAPRPASPGNAKTALPTAASRAPSARRLGSARWWSPPGRECRRAAGRCRHSA